MAAPRETPRVLDVRDFAQAREQEVRALGRGSGCQRSPRRRGPEHRRRNTRLNSPSQLRFLLNAVRHDVGDAAFGVALLPRHLRRYA